MRLLPALLFAVYLIAWTETCFLDREEVHGSNRICYYDCLSGEAAVTVRLWEMCPLTVRR